MDGTPISPDGEKLPTEASSDLRKRVQRIQMFTEGNHTPSDSRLGPTEITHELLLTAQDIVANGAPPVTDRQPAAAARASVLTLERC